MNGQPVTPSRALAEALRRIQQPPVESRRAVAWRHTSFWLHVAGQIVAHWVRRLTGAAR